MMLLVVKADDYRITGLASLLDTCSDDSTQSVISFEYKCQTIHLSPERKELTCVVRAQSTESTKTC